MIPSEIQLVVDEVLVAVRHFTRAAYGIAVGGAHAKGAADAESDLDIYLFAEDALPRAERESRVLELCPGARTWFLGVVMVRWCSVAPISTIGASGSNAGCEARS